MILRRVTEHVKTQNWFAVTIDFVIVVIGVFVSIQVSNWNAARLASLAAGAALLAARAAAAEPLTADLLPPQLLADCEDNALPFERYAPPVAAAARSLINIGVFAAQEFVDVRVGFCALQKAGGPAATASCTDGVILLDEKYARADLALVLKATLAHEVKHHLQHIERRSRFGDGYCASPRYADDKPVLEAEAEAFGDKVMELFTLGRAIEIVNACDAPLSIYLEAADPVAVRGAMPTFQRVAARGSAIANERALTGDVRFFAMTTPASGATHVWQDPAGVQTRFVEGRHVRLKARTLPARDRVEAPFRLRLTCPPR